MVKDLKQAVEDYKEKSLPRLPKKIEGIRSKESYLDHILSGKTKEARVAFRAAEKRIIPKLNRCTNAEEISDICYDAFDPIRGIGQQTISDYIYHVLHIRDIDPESNCYTLLTLHARTALNKRGYISENNLVTFKKNDLFKDFDSIAFIDFANKNYRSFSRSK